VPRISEHNLATAIELARAAADVRGYGHVKDESVKAFQVRRDKLLATLDAPAPAAQPRKTILLSTEKL
jgi:hypothetical protein